MEIKTILGRVLYSDNSKTIKECVENAVKRNVDLSYANLSGVNLSGVDLSGARLNFANLRGSDLSGSNLSYSGLSYTDLTDANLPNTDLFFTQLDHVKGVVVSEFLGWTIYTQEKNTRIGCNYLDNERFLNMTFEWAKRIGCEKDERIFKAYKALLKTNIEVLKTLNS